MENVIKRVFGWETSQCYSRPLAWVCDLHVL